MAADATVTLKYNADTAAAQGSMNSFGSTLKKIGGIMAAVFSIKAIYEIGAAFEKSFAKASTLIDKTSVSIEGLRKNVIKLSNDTGVAGTEINEGLYQAISAGVKITGDGSDALAFMTQNLKLAKGGFTDLTTSVDATTTIINAYGLEQSKVNQISDMLITTQNEGKTTVAELGGQMSQVVPIAASLNLGFDQVGASLATMTAQGDGTSMAATKLRALLTELSKSTTEAGQAFERVSGQTFPEFIASGGTLSEAMVMMQGYADQTGVGMVDLFSSVEAAGAAMMIASDTGAAKFDKSLNTLRNSAGSTDKAFKEMTNTAEYKMEKAFNKLKNAGVQAFAALSPIINLVSGAISAVADALMYVIEGFNGTNIAATVVTSTLTALTVVWGALLIIQNAHSIAVAANIVITKIQEAAFYAVAAAGYAMGIGMTAALGVIGLFILAIAALIAIIVIFCNNPMAAEAKRIKGELKDLNEELEQTQKDIEADAAAGEKLANELIALSQKTEKSADDIALMQVKVRLLNKALGEEAVAIDESTGALTLNGKALDENGQALLDLIAAKKKNAKVEALETAAAEARTLQAEAEANMLLAQEEANGENTHALRKATEAYNEATKAVEQYDEMMAELIETQIAEEAAIADLEMQAAASMTEEQKRQAIRANLESQRELTTAEHYAKLQELMASNYVELGMTEEEYIVAMAEHQKAIEDATLAHQQAIEEATQEHVDTLFGINEEGLYNEAHTVEELNAIWTKNQEDEANYYANLNALADAGFDGLAQVFEDGGVEIGGSLQNTMDGLQGIGLDGWLEIQADWEANGGQLSETMREKYGDINVEAGLAVLKLAETTQQGLEDAARYGEEAVGELVGGVEDTMADADTAMATGGETLAETSEQAGEDAAAGFVAGVDAHRDDVMNIGKLTGNSYVTGILAGLELMRDALMTKARSLAYSMNEAFEDALDINSPSKVGKRAGKFYPMGVAEGVDEGTPYAVGSVVNMADAMVDASQLVSIPYAGAGYGGSVVYNNQRSVNVNATYQSQVAGESTPGLEYLDFVRQLKGAFA